MRNALIALGVVVLIAAAFWGGTMYANAGTSDGTATAGTFTPGDAPAGGMAGGPMADLTDEQIAEMEGMTQEERAAYLEEQGIDMPTGAAAGAPGGTRGGQLEGEVLDATAEMLTIELESGSQTVYLDEDTTVAYAEGATDLAAGSQVVVIAEPATDGVTMATVVVVK